MATALFISRLEEIAIRVSAPEVIRACDDPVLWDWRAYLSRRRSAIIEK